MRRDASQLYLNLTNMHLICISITTAKVFSLKTISGMQLKCSTAANSVRLNLCVLSYLAVTVAWSCCYPCKPLD